MSKSTLFRFSFFGFLFKVFLLTALFLGGALLWFCQDFPNINQIGAAFRKPSVTILSHNDGSIVTFGDIFEKMVHVKELPAHVTGAILAVEDRRFYSHFGLDIIGLFRAIYTNYQSGRIRQGGSTITQQLAKNILVSQGCFSVSDRSLKRKIQEVVLSLWLENKFSKDEILTMYLNRVYFGAGTYGVDAAAHRYFKKKAKDLSVFEAAILAGLLRAPSKYSPAHNPEKAVKRAMTVLKLMQSEGMLKDYELYIKPGVESLSKVQLTQDSTDKYFADWIYDSLPDLVGSVSDDLIVKTTLDPVIQHFIKKAAIEMLHQYGKELKVSEVAVVAMSPDGLIRGMLGGINYQKTQFNRATQAARPAGSAFKPFVYLAALEKGYTPDDMIEDTPVHLKGWSPRNFKWKSRGHISMREGLTYSVNAVAVRLAQRVGTSHIEKVAKRLGVMSDIHKELSMSVGTVETTLLEMTTSYAAFANHGYAVWPSGVELIKTKDGKVLFERQESKRHRVIQPNHLEDMLDMFHCVIQSGTGRACKIDEDTYGKTGTNADKDAWFFVFHKDDVPSRDLVLGVWIGNDQNQPMSKKSTGGRLPAKIAHSFFKQYFDFMKKNPSLLQRLGAHVLLKNSNTENDASLEKKDQKVDAESPTAGETIDSILEKADQEKDKAEESESKKEVNEEEISEETLEGMEGDEAVGKLLETEE